MSELKDTKKDSDKINLVVNRFFVSANNNLILPLNGMYIFNGPYGGREAVSTAELLGYAQCQEEAVDFITPLDNEKKRKNIVFCFLRHLDQINLKKIISPNIKLSPYSGYSSLHREKNNKDPQVLERNKLKQKLKNCYRSFELDENSVKSGEYSLDNIIPFHKLEDVFARNISSDYSSHCFEKQYAPSVYALKDRVIALAGRPFGDVYARDYKGLAEFYLDFANKNFSLFVQKTIKKLDDNVDISFMASKNLEANGILNKYSVKMLKCIGKVFSESPNEYVNALTDIYKQRDNGIADSGHLKVLLFLKNKGHHYSKDYDNSYVSGLCDVLKENKVKLRELKTILSYPISPKKSVFLEYTRMCSLRNKVRNDLREALIRNGVTTNESEIKSLIDGSDSDEVNSMLHEVKKYYGSPDPSAFDFFPLQEESGKIIPVEKGSNSSFLSVTIPKVKLLRVHKEKKVHE